MPTAPVPTTQLHAWIDRLRTGDPAAGDEMLQAVYGPLERLARQMIKHFPGLRRWADADDVLQNALIRLIRALRQVRPESTQAFYGLAAVQIRRELLDLQRRCHADAMVADEGRAAGGGLSVSEEEADEVARWTAFHEDVAALPAVEREVICLIFYHGWKQAEVAELFHVTARTVRRRWDSAVAKLRRRLKGDN